MEEKVAKPKPKLSECIPNLLEILNYNKTIETKFYESTGTLIIFNIDKEYAGPGILFSRKINIVNSYTYDLLYLDKEWRRAIAAGIKTIILDRFGFHDVYIFKLLQFPVDLVLKNLLIYDDCSTYRGGHDSIEHMKRQENDPNYSQRKDEDARITYLATSLEFTIADTPLKNPDDPDEIYTNLENKRKAEIYFGKIQKFLKERS